MTNLITPCASFSPIYPRAAILDLVKPETVPFDPATPNSTLEPNKPFEFSNMVAKPEIARYVWLIHNTQDFRILFYLIQCLNNPLFPIGKVSPCFFTLFSPFDTFTFILTSGTRQWKFYCCCRVPDNLCLDSSIDQSESVIDRSMAE